MAGLDDRGRAEVALIDLALVNQLLALRVRAVAAAASLASGVGAERGIRAGCAGPVSADVRGRSHLRAVGQENGWK